MGDLFSGPSNRNRTMMEKQMEKQTSKILLLISLFNDNLANDPGSFRRMDSSFTIDSDTSSAADSTTPTENGLIRIALLRDTLFMVGHYSLQLAIADELFNRYPDASEDDLRLQRTCSTSDDVMAYIMVKSGFHQSLYHQESRAEKRFVSEMSAAESVGQQVWKRRGGWIVKGGELEFARRRGTLSLTLPQGPPRYCGLAGGRLYGHKSKLPGSLTEDLVFSLKSVAGALVLSLGLEGMWQNLGPLFDELLLLSAEELRKEYYKDSTICKK
jgi:dsRNA-specific ribonuclease